MARTALRPLGATFAAALGLSAAPATQAADPPQRIVVTGSRLPGVMADTAGPVQVITRAQIDRSGATSVAGLLKTLPAGNAQGADEAAVLSFAPGVGALSLRGLGTQATLVLLDGRRIAPSGFVPDGQTSAVNLSMVPLAAIERVEVLLDGASAVYGSDAVGGVVNLITRTSHAGVVARAQVGRSLAQGDAGRRRASLTLGLPSGNGFTGVLGFEHAAQDAVKASSRPRTASADFTRWTGDDWRSTYAYPGNLYVPGGADGGGTTPLGPIASPVSCPPAPAGSALAGLCAYDPVQHQDLVPRTQRDAMFGSAQWPLGDRVELFASALVSRLRFEQESPTFGTDLYRQFFGSTPGAAISLPAEHPQNPYGTPVALRYRWADRPFVTDMRAIDSRMVLGLRGDLGPWQAEAAATVSRSDSKALRSGVIRDSVVYTDVLDPARGYEARSSFVFGNPSANDPAVMARLYPTLVSRGVTSVRAVDARASRDIAMLPGGPLALLAGAEWRRETFASRPDPLQAAGEISVAGSYAAGGAREVAAVFAEMSAPLRVGLDALAAVRVDRYEGFGLTASPRLGLRWQAGPAVALRASVARGFRAPSIGELTQAPTLGFYAGLRDPVLCPDPSQVANPACSGFVLAQLTRGARLEPERSLNTTLGLVATPSPATTLTVDIYRIRRHDEIASYDPGYVLANEARLPGLVARDPGTGAITSMTLPLTNIGVTRLWGLDLAAETRWRLADAGSLTLALQANAQPSVKVTPIPGAESEQRAGSYQRPRWRGSVAATWERDAWAVQASARHVGGYRRSYSPSDADCGFAGTAFDRLCSVGSWTTLDLGMTWRATNRTELTLQVRNVANRQPPIDERFTALIYTLYNPLFHDALGRMVTLGVQARF